MNVTVLGLCDVVSRWNVLLTQALLLPLMCRDCTNRMLGRFWSRCKPGGSGSKGFQRLQESGREQTGPSQSFRRKMVKAQFKKSAEEAEMFQGFSDKLKLENPGATSAEIEENAMALVRATRKAAKN